MTSSAPSLVLLVSGGALLAVSAIGLLLPGSVFAYPHSIAASEPLTVLYDFQGGLPLLTAALVSLSAFFVLAVWAASRSPSRQAAAIAIAVAALLAALYVGIYPSSSQDLFHNIASARLLWIYGENPLVTPPAAHPDDPLVQQVRAWRDVSSFYGPLFYAASTVPAKLAGDDVLRNLLAFKAFHALGLLALALLAGEAAERLVSGSRARAVIMVGWNPLLLYEHVANAHNDVLMSFTVVAALLVATQARAIGGVVVAALSAAVKYPAAALVPVLWVWSWKRGERSQRMALAALAIAGAILAAAILVVFANQVEIGKEAAIGRPPVRSLVALLHHGLQPLLGPASLSAARVICWAAFLAVLLLALRRLGTTPESLYRAAFWVMAALTLLTVRQIYPSYLIWFVCLGAILVGTTAWELSLVASLSGLLSNLVFTEWATWGVADDVAFMAAFVGLPALALAASQRLRMSRPNAERAVQSVRLRADP